MDFLSDKIKKARVLLRLSQVKAAVEAGISQKDISRIESGKAKFIPKEYLFFLSKKGINLNWLYNEEEKSAAQEHVFLKDTEKDPNKTFQNSEKPHKIYSIKLSKEQVEEPFTHYDLKEIEHILKENQDLKKEVMQLNAQNEALYKAFRELGIGNSKIP